MGKYFTLCKIESHLTIQKFFLCCWGCGLSSPALHLFNEWSLNAHAQIINHMLLVQQIAYDGECMGGCSDCNCKYLCWAICLYKLDDVTIKISYKSFTFTRRLRLKDRSLVAQSIYPSFCIPPPKHNTFSVSNQRHQHNGAANDAETRVAQGSHKCRNFIMEYKYAI